MIVGKLYVDAMDPERVVAPTNALGECRVYFNGEYTGNARVPPSLFNDAGEQNRLSWIGFNPYRAYEPDLHARVPGDNDEDEKEDRR